MDRDLERGSVVSTKPESTLAQPSDGFASEAEVEVDAALAVDVFRW